MAQNIPFPLTQSQQDSSNNQTPTNSASTLNAQPQMAAQPNALPLPPGLDMSVLAGVTPEQFAAVVRMIQQGVVPMPPSAAHAPAPPIAAAAAPTAPAATWPTAPPPPPAEVTPSLQNASAEHSNGHDVDMDKEEGELEEGEMEDAPKARDFLRTPPRGPRKRSRSPLHRGQAAQSDRRGSQQGQGVARPVPLQRASSSTASTQASRPNGAGSVVGQTVNGHVPKPPLGKDAAAKAFIVEMYRNGYGFDHLSREVGDTKALRRMYQQLALPIPSSSSSDSPVNQGGVPLAQQTRKVSMPKTTKAPTPQNRSEYLAKLQAAKNKKAEASAKSATPPAIPATAPTTDTPTADPRLQSTPRTSALSKDKTDLIRQRLEKLKAEQAAKLQAKLPSDPASSETIKRDSHDTTPQLTNNTGLGAGLVEAVARASDKAAMHAASKGLNVAPSNLATQPPFPSASPTLNRGFGLPGLFTTTLASSQPNVAPLQPPLSRSVSFTPGHKASATPTEQPQRPASAVEQAPNGSDTPKQTFGQSRNVYNNDRYVIEVSSDEDEGDAMDLDDGAANNVADSIHYANSTLRTAKPNFHIPSGGFSTPTTPRVGTPNADLKRKLEEIEEAKRRIAEAEKKRKKGGKGKTPVAQQDALVEAVDQLIASSSALASDNVTPEGAQKSPESTTVPTDGFHQTSSAVDFADRPSSTSSASARLAREQEKETLRRRLAELEAQRSKLDSANGSGATQAQPNFVHAGSASSTLPSAWHQAQPPATNFDDQNDSDDIDDEDDEDLYGEDVADQNANNIPYVPQPSHVGSQATTVDPESQSQDDRPQAQPGTYPFRDDAMEDTDSAQSIPGLTAGREVATTDQISTAEQTTAYSDVEDDLDEDDLDNLYAPSASVSAAGPAVQTLNDAMASNDDQEDDSGDAMDTSDASSSDSDDSIDFEPESQPEPDIEVLANPVQPVESPTFAAGPLPSSASQIENVGDGQDETGDEDDDDEDDEEDDSEDSEDSEDETDNTNDVQGIVDDEGSLDDNLALELQPRTEELDVPEAPRPKTFYTPYQSPLHRFKDYRFHPDFEQTVSGGFKSLTYSHKIDPNATLCPFELNGGTCIDKACENQHFRALALSDNELLRLIGTEHTPARTPDEEKRWKEGLAALVKQLRAKNIKDVATIAHRIAEYRRAFVEDPTRVLGFED